jgi:hypothetical protein
MQQDRENELSPSEKKGAAPLRARELEASKSEQQDISCFNGAACHAVLPVTLARLGHQVNY